MDWNTDLSKAPRNGMLLLGHDVKANVEIMHYANGWLAPNYDGMGKGHFTAFRPIAWAEIPPINIREIQRKSK